MTENDAGIPQRPLKWLFLLSAQLMNDGAPESRLRTSG
jgi:hypothetical protein